MYDGLHVVIESRISLCSGSEPYTSSASKCVTILGGSEGSPNQGEHPLVLCSSGCSLMNGEFQRNVPESRFSRANPSIIAAKVHRLSTIGKNSKSTSAIFSAHATKMGMQPEAIFHTTILFAYALETHHKLLRLRTVRLTQISTVAENKQSLYALETFR